MDVLLYGALGLVALGFALTLRHKPPVAMRPGQRIPHLYKWSRHHADFVAWQITYADAHPRNIQGSLYWYEPVHPDCYFKINHELTRVEPTAYAHAEGLAEFTRADRLELLIECKMVLTRDGLGGEDFYVLRLRPLRGTDVWPIITKFIERLGPPDTLCVARDIAGGDLWGPETSARSSQDIELVWNCWGRPLPMPNSKAEQVAP